MDHIDRAAAAAGLIIKPVDGGWQLIEPTDGELFEHPLTLDAALKICAEVAEGRAADQGEAVEQAAAEFDLTNQTPTDLDQANHDRERQARREKARAKEPGPLCSPEALNLYQARERAKDAQGKLF